MFYRQYATSLENIPTKRVHYICSKTTDSLSDSWKGNRMMWSDLDKISKEGLCKKKKTLKLLIVDIFKISSMQIHIILLIINFFELQLQ